MSPTAAARATSASLDAPAQVESVELPDHVRQAHISDVAALPSGGVALLLRDLSQVAVLRTGDDVQWFGREGRGPGEFSDPLAIAASADGFLVIDRVGVHVFDLEGSPLKPSRLPWLGDWGLVGYRRPLLYHDAPFQMGPEDMSRRVSAIPGGYAILGRERSSTAALENAQSSQRLPLLVLTVSRRGGAADSIASVMGPERVAPKLQPTSPSGEPIRGVVPMLAEPLFGDRPLIAGTDHWRAVADPAADQVDVIFADGSHPLRVVWPSEKHPVTDTTRVHFMDRYFADIVNAATSDSLASAWRRNGGRMSFGAKLAESAPIEVADSLANLSALFADGDCLWLIGMDPRDYTDGTSHWGVQVHLRKHAVHGPVRLATRGRRLLDLGHGFAYSVHRTWDGEFRLERTPLPACAR